MIGDLATLLSIGVQKALLIASLFVTVSLLLYFKKRLASDFEDFKEKLSAHEKMLQTHVQSTQALITLHNDTLTKASRSISGDVLKTKETLFNLKHEFIGRLEELKEFASKLERETKMMGEKLSITVERFEDRIARVLEAQKFAQEAIGRITHIESAIAEFRIESDTRLTAAAKILKSHDEQLARIKSPKKEE